MRAFRYGGVNVTYFLPKSTYRMDTSIDPATTDRLSLPSVCRSIRIIEYLKIYFSLKKKHLLMLCQYICEV